jgi:UDP:flavonoid glycosyltransferase YjiC (YdhE family)
MPSIVLICPPFYSHFGQMLSLAVALRNAGATVTMACTPDFADKITAAGIGFYPLRVTNNANTGIAAQTQQAEQEKQRLQTFFEATKEGAVPTLLVQTEHRRMDMLAEPERIRAEIAMLHAELRPDWYLIDQLSYSVTLAMYCLRLPFATISPGHPTYIVPEEGYFGYPYAWLPELRPSDEELATLLAAVQETDHAFTETFNRVIYAHDPNLPLVERAFRLTSPHALILNYPELSRPPLAPDPRHIWMGHSITEEPIPLTWKAKVEAMQAYPYRVMVAFGTFLSVREDVLRKVIVGIQGVCPDTLVIVGAGNSATALGDLASEHVWIEEFLPQKALLPYVDAMVHHGGNNSFTECLYFGKPALILPFSSDQFSIAYDAQTHHLARALDPNRATPEDIGHAVCYLFNDQSRVALAAIQQQLHERGAAWAVDQLLEMMNS